MTERWDFILYLAAGSSIRYQDKTLYEAFKLIADWPARSNSPVVSFRARRVPQQEASGETPTSNRSALK